jgi:hypothetical protein
MICGACKGSGWILPPLDIAHNCAPVAMRCECRGGPEALAKTIETSEMNPDPVLAQKIRNSWQGIGQYEYANGLKRPACKCQIEEVPF